jgi:hypothetical protein
MAKGERDYMGTNDNAFTTYGKNPVPEFRGKLNTSTRRKSRKQVRKELEMSNTVPFVEPKTYVAKVHMSNSQGGAVCRPSNPTESGDLSISSERSKVTCLKCSAYFLVSNEPAVTKVEGMKCSKAGSGVNFYFPVNADSVYEFFNGKGVRVSLEQDGIWLRPTPSGASRSSIGVAVRKSRGKEYRSMAVAPDHIDFAHDYDHFGLMAVEAEIVHDQGLRVKYPKRFVPPRSFPNRSKRVKSVAAQAKKAEDSHVTREHFRASLRVVNRFAEQEPGLEMQIVDGRLKAAILEEFE